MDKITGFFKKVVEEVAEALEEAHDTTSSGSEKSTSQSLPADSSNATPAAGGKGGAQNKGSNTIATPAAGEKGGVQNKGSNVLKKSPKKQQPKRSISTTTAKDGSVERVWEYARMKFTAKVWPNRETGGEFTLVQDGKPFSGDIQLAPKFYLELRYKGPPEQRLEDIINENKQFVAEVEAFVKSVKAQG